MSQKTYAPIVTPQTTQSGVDSDRTKAMPRPEGWWVDRPGIGRKMHGPSDCRVRLAPGRIAHRWIRLLRQIARTIGFDSVKTSRLGASSGKSGGRPNLHIPLLCSIPWQCPLYIWGPWTATPVIQCPRVPGCKFIHIHNFHDVPMGFRLHCFLAAPVPDSCTYRHTACWVYGLDICHVFSYVGRAPRGAQLVACKRSNQTLESQMYVD
jgi:hypothetical protein